MSGEQATRHGRRHDRAGGARRPRRRSRRARARTTRARRSTTSTRRRCSAPSAGRPSTTCAALRRTRTGAARAGLPDPRPAASSSSPRRRSAGIGGTALRRVFSGAASAAAAATTTSPDAGAAGELTGAAGRGEFGDEQPLDVVPHRPQRGPARAARRRRGVAPRRRRLRGGRDRAAYLGRGLPARRPVVLDGAARHVGRRRSRRRWRCTPWSRRSIPQDAHRDRRLQRLRPRAAPDRARRAGLRTWCRAPTCSTR